MLTALTLGAAGAKDIVYTKARDLRWHGGECFSLIVAAVRGHGDDGDEGITVDDNGVWHDSLTHADIDPGKDGFTFTVKRHGHIIATAKVTDDNKFVIHPIEHLPLPMAPGRADPERELNDAWHALSPEQRAELRSEEMKWIAYKDTLSGDAKKEEVAKRAAYLRSLAGQ